MRRAQSRPSRCLQRMQSLQKITAHCGHSTNISNAADAIRIAAIRCVSKNERPEANAR